MTRSTYRVIVLLALFLFALQEQLFAQMFRRDSTFNLNGLAIPAAYPVAGGNFHQLKKILVQPDGKILLVGANNGQSFIEIVRLDTNGIADPTFGTNGYYQGNASGGTSVLANAVLAPDGKIMLLSTEVSPTTTFSFLYRINTNGTRDNTFGSGGQVSLGNGAISSLTGIIFQPDGKIVLSGSRNIANQVNPYMVLRLNANGTFDNSFGLNGEIENVYAQFASGYTTMSNAAIQPDGKILVSGFINVNGNTAKMAVIRFKANGTADSSFAINGCRTYDQIDTSANITSTGIAVDSSTGDIYTYGATGLVTPTSDYYYRPFITKLTAAGAIATSFGTNGFFIYNTPLTHQLGTRIYPPAIFRQPDGKFIIAGTSDSSSTSHTRVYRVTASGQIDNTFCNAGVLDLPRNVRDMVMHAAPQKNGDILLGGFTYNKANTGMAIFNDTSYMYCFRITSRTKQPSGGINNTVDATGKMQVYPNPATGGRFHLAYEGITAGETLQLDLFDVTGRTVSTQSFKANNKSGVFDFIPANPLSGGVYLLKVSSELGSYPATRLLVD